MFKPNCLILVTLIVYRLFGATGNCVACNKVIPAFEMVMRAKSFVYHLECFACQQCNHRYAIFVICFNNYYIKLYLRDIRNYEQQNVYVQVLRG